MFKKFHVSQDPDGAWVAESLALPGCATRGRSRAEAVACLQEAVLALWNDPLWGLDLRERAGEPAGRRARAPGRPSGR